jgi:hypothetical protein
MVIEHKNFDEKIREAFGDFEVMPPAHVWYGISLGMAPPAPRRVVPLLLKVAAGFAIFILSSLSFWFLAFQPSGDMHQLATMNAFQGAVSDQPETFSDAIAESQVVTASAVNTIRSSLTSAQTLVQPAIGIPSPVGFIVPPSLMASLAGEKPVLLPATLDFSQEILPLVEGSGFIAYSAKGADNSFSTFGLLIAPQYSYRHIPRSGRIGYAGIPFESLEQYLLSYNASLSFDFQLSPRVGIRTGLSYSILGQFIRDIFSFSNPENAPLFEYFGNQKFGHPQTILTSQGYIRLSEPTLFFADAESYRIITNKQFFPDGNPKNLVMRDFGISQYFTFLEVPVLAQYKVLEMQHADIRLKAGGSMNYLLSNEVFLGRKSMQKPIGETYGLRKFNFSVIGGVALNIPLNNHLNLTFEPTAQIFLMPMVRDPLMIGRALPFQYSVFTGITYGF